MTSMDFQPPDTRETPSATDDALVQMLARSTAYLESIVTFHGSWLGARKLEIQMHNKKAHELLRRMRGW